MPGRGFFEAAARSSDKYVTRHNILTVLRRLQREVAAGEAVVVLIKHVRPYPDLGVVVQMSGDLIEDAWITDACPGKVTYVNLAGIQAGIAAGVHEGFHYHR